MWDPSPETLAQEERVYIKNVGQFKNSAETLLQSLHFVCTRRTWTSIQSSIQLTYTRPIQAISKSFNLIGRYLCLWQRAPYVRVVFYLWMVLKREKRMRVSRVHLRRARTLHRSKEEGGRMLLKLLIRPLAVPKRRKRDRYRQASFSE